MIDLRACRFDGVALWHAMNAQRLQRELTWNGVTRELRDAEADLATRLGKRNHPIAASTMAKLEVGPSPAAISPSAICGGSTRCPKSF